MAGELDLNFRQPYDEAPHGRFLVNEIVETAISPIAVISHWKPPMDSAQ